MITSPTLQPERTVRDFYTSVYRRFKLFKETPGRYDAYLDCLNQFRAHLGREPVLSDLDEDTAADWMQSIVRKGGSPATANARLRHLKALARFAFKRGYVAAPLDVDKFRVPKRLPEAWSPEELELILLASRRASGIYLGIPGAKWWPAVLLTLYDTGLRRTAALGIRFDELDFRRKTLRVPAERMKNSVEQVFHLSDQTIEAILDTLPPPRELVFPWPFVCPHVINKRLREIVTLAGLKCGARDLFHKIRRTTATQIAVKHGEHVAIQQLGHSSPGTIKSYIDPRFLASHTAARTIFRPGWDRPASVEVEHLDGALEAVPPEMLRNVRVFERDIKGISGDAFAALLRKPRLGPKDVLAVLGAMRMSYVDMAKAIGVRHQTLWNIIRHNCRVSDRINKRLRVAIGLTHTWNRRETNVEVAS